MIVSHEHRFIFLKTRKTAGTSVEVFLDRLAGEKGIVTPIEPPVDGHRPRHHTPPLLAPLSVLRGDAPGVMRRHRRLGLWYYNHMPARQVRARVGPRRWRSYYKFCFERNPWDKTVSFYYFKYRDDPSPPSLRDFVLHKKLPSDFNIYSLDGETVDVDFVGRFEQLDTDLQRALDDLGIDHPISLTREKSGSRPAETSAELFDDEMSARIERGFRREIAAFGYERPLPASLAEDSNRHDSRT